MGLDLGANRNVFMLDTVEAILERYMAKFSKGGTMDLNDADLNLASAPAPAPAAEKSHLPVSQSFVCVIVRGTHTRVSD